MSLGQALERHNFSFAILCEMLSNTLQRLRANQDGIPIQHQNQRTLRALIDSCYKFAHKALSFLLVIHLHLPLTLLLGHILGVHVGVVIRRINFHIH